MGSGSGAGQHILVVDDEPGIREIMTQALRKEGHSVTEASDGVEALALFSNNPFDLVITDFELPGMKGDELVEKVRRLVPGQRIIMVSGAWPEFGSPLPKVDFCLDKPFQLTELVVAVRYVVQDISFTKTDSAAVQ